MGIGFGGIGGRLLPCGELCRVKFSGGVLRRGVLCGRRGERFKIRAAGAAKEEERMNRIFLRFPDFREKTLTFSYDDGVASDRRLIGILSACGLKGTFNLNSGLFDAGGNRLTAAEAKALYTNACVEVAAHGQKHYSLEDVPFSLALQDVAADKAALEEMFGTVIEGMAYANGSAGAKAEEAVRACGIGYARTTVSTGSFSLPENWLKLPATCHHNDARLFALAEAFLSETPNVLFWRGGPRMFYVWGHSYEFDGNGNWDVIERFAEKMSGRQDIWYATNGEIFRYVRAYDRLQFAAEAKFVYNPSACDVYLDVFGRRRVARAGEVSDLR